MPGSVADGGAGAASACCHTAAAANSRQASRSKPVTADVAAGLRKRSCIALISLTTIAHEIQKGTSDSSGVGTVSALGGGERKTSGFPVTYPDTHASPRERFPPIALF